MGPDRNAPEHSGPVAEIRTLKADVVAIGFGAAGAAAAIAATEAGADVIVIERQPRHAHTPNARMSGGVIMEVQDGASALGYMDACAGGLVPRDVTAAWADRATGLMEWLRQRGIAINHELLGHGEHEAIEGYEAVKVYRAPAGRASETGHWLAAMGVSNSDQPAGPELWDQILGAVTRSEASVRWGTRARRLCRDESGRVVAVEAEDDMGPLRIEAISGIVLCCGGYEFDAEMRAQFLKAPMWFYGNPGNEGDGIRMAQQVGASLWHMNLSIGRGIGRFAEPDGTERNFLLYMRPGGYLLTGRDGRRFANEISQAELGHAFFHEMIHFDAATNSYPRIPSYWFFDSRRMKAGPLASERAGLVGVGAFEWSRDNRREVSRGWICEGATVREVAARSGVADPAAAEETVARYNDACRSGSDPLGRPAESLVPLDAPPFYCVPLYPGGSNTCGGPRRDAQGRILDAFGEPIPGLFGAGELGQTVGMLYPAAGANLSEAFCSARIAIESALRLQQEAIEA